MLAVCSTSPLPPFLRKNCITLDLGLVPKTKNLKTKHLRDDIPNITDLKELSYASSLIALPFIWPHPLLVRAPNQRRTQVYLCLHFTSRVKRFSPGLANAPSAVERRGILNPRHSREFRDGPVPRARCAYSVCSKLPHPEPGESYDADAERVQIA